MAGVAVLAPAKINLALHVTALRSDGYHDIETLAAFAQAGDRIQARRADADSFSLSGPFAAALEGEPGNLVLDARDALRRAAGHSAGSVTLHLEKNLPVASGIGGGSADAAATLLALKQSWGLPADFTLAEIAGKLGADVPMCLASRPLLASGVGENIKPLDLPRSLHAVLVNPGVAVPTRTVFGLLERRDNPPMEPLPPHGFDMDWLARQRNDLQAPAIAAYPAIDTVLEHLAASEGSLLTRMSGSGATCFALYGSAQAAQVAARQIAREQAGWWCIATQLMAGEYPGRLTDLEA
jgi:4-diphosphocytidyl-2-C-methyl-D-erythritol kinase